MLSFTIFLLCFSQVLGKASIRYIGTEGATLVNPKTLNLVQSLDALHAADVVARMMGAPILSSYNINMPILNVLDKNHLKKPVLLEIEGGKESFLPDSLETVVEMVRNGATLLANSDDITAILSKQGIKFKMGSKVNSVKTNGTGILINFTDVKTSKAESLEFDKVLVSVGRKPYTEGLNLTKVGIKKDSKGRIEVNSKLQTSIKNIYAIGDVIKGPMLAHKAEEEGIAVAEVIAGQAGHVNFEVIPSVVYTDPEVAAVGKTENELKEAGIGIKVGKFSFMGNGRAKTVFSNNGFVKIIADSNSDKILGAHIIGPAAGDLVHEVCVAMEFGASTEDLARTCHAHPTFSEAVREAALACGLGAIHSWYFRPHILIACKLINKHLSTFKATNS